MAVRRTYSIAFLGDVMLGRLIDQLLPMHVHEPGEHKIAQSLVASRPHLRDYTLDSPWGSTLALLRSSDIRIINLETSVTTHDIKWPDKVFNYRMHPANILTLLVPKIDYVSLANNHTLDFCEAGLTDTIDTLKKEKIAFAGAGHSRQEALRPAILTLRNGHKDYQVHIWSAADHPSEWASVPEFHLLDYTQATRARLKSLLGRHENTPRAALRVFSVHWGPNYAWSPSKEIQSLAHFLVDECDIDIVHGHSSHHVQGVEKYKGSLIIYGCGDFVDDYALVPEFRNDLSAVWRVTVEESTAESTPQDHNVSEESSNGLKVKQLEIFPTRIKHFQAYRLDIDDRDHSFVVSKIRALSANLGTDIADEVGADGQIFVNI